VGRRTEASEPTKKATAEPRTGTLGEPCGLEPVRIGFWRTRRGLERLACVGEPTASVAVEEDIDDGGDWPATAGISLVSFSTVRFLEVQRQ